MRTRYGFRPKVGFTSVQMIYWLAQVSPTPGPSANGSGQSWFDLKDYVTGLAVTLTGSVLLSIWAVVKQRARIGRFFKRIGGFFADRWKRLNTPLDSRENQGSPADRTALEQVEAMRNQMDSTDLKVIAARQQTRLPARWGIKSDLRELGAMTLENLGPGDAHQVIVDSSISGAAVRNGYWEEFPKQSEQVFRVDPPEWVANEDLYFILQWTDDQGEEKSAHLDVPVFFH